MANRQENKDTLYAEKRTYQCYLDTVPSVVVNPVCKYVLRDKVTNKEISPWFMVKHLGGQQVQVAQSPASVQQFNDFLNKVGSDEEIGDKVKNRENKKWAITAEGMYLKEDDKKIYLMMTADTKFYI